MPMPRFDSVDDYIASFPEDVQERLQQVRRTIHETVPAVQETMSYATPSFTLDGKYLVYLSAWKSHLGFYGHTAAALEKYADQVAPYVGPKGALRFPYKQPLPLQLIADITKFCAEERQAQARKG